MEYEDIGSNSRRTARSVYVGNERGRHPRSVTPRRIGARFRGTVSAKFYRHRCGNLVDRELEEGEEGRPIIRVFRGTIRCEPVVFRDRDEGDGGILRRKSGIHDRAGVFADFGDIVGNILDGDE